MSEIRVDGKTLGQLAFEAYRDEVQGAAYDDKPIPPWDEMHGNRERSHRGWEMAAATVATWVRGSDLVDREFDRMNDGPVDYRQQHSRVQPLRYNAPAPLEDAPVTGLDRVGDDRAATAKASVEVRSGDELHNS